MKAPENGLKNEKKISAVKKMLKKYGSSNEKIYFSDHVVKINRRSKKQIRFLLITDMALYNLLPNNLSKCKRRIKIELIGSMSISKLSDEFVLHVFDEYDYQYKSNKKEAIKDILGELYNKKTNKKLNVKYKLLNNLREVVLTKKKSRLQSREEKLRRRDLLLELDENDSDKEEAFKNESLAENILEPTKRISIDDFILLKVIGRGSFGKVLQVKKKDTEKIYAMKILKKSGVVYQNQVEHTKAERKILQVIQHPFLMKLRFAFQTKYKLYIVIDFYKGGELFFHLKRKNKFSETEARFIIAETVLALGHLHKNDVFYRDLKPENILLDDKGHICLTDFGLSKIFDEMESKEANTFCGTPEYLAPEIIERKYYTKAIDWWSLGILLYELVVGYPPFYNKDTNEMYRMIQKAKVNYPKFLSSEATDLMNRLIERNPQSRLGSGPKDCEEIMAHDFFKEVNWEAMMKRSIKAPYVPATRKRNTDTTNFDTEFTSEPVADSFVSDMSLNNDYFDNFSYQS